MVGKTPYERGTKAYVRSVTEDEYDVEAER